MNHRFLRSSGLLAAALASAAVITTLGAGRLRAADATTIPPPAQDEATTGPSVPRSEVAVFAGGCFWGVQGVFEHVKGVTRAVAGYAGGERAGADYETVSSGSTGHAEAVEVTFDPSQVSYGKLLQVFFSVVHDPTTLDRQGPDRGTQYRSAIFPRSDQQEAISRAYIAQLQAAHVYAGSIVTRIEAHRPFYAAEGYHQNFLERHPNYPYIVFNDLPKVGELQRRFPELYRKDAVLAPQ